MFPLSTNTAALPRRMKHRGCVGEYGFYSYFYQDGTLQLEVKLTGVISNGAAAPDERPKWGEVVAPQVNAPIHQRFFNVRLDMMVDGPNSSVH